MASLSEKKSLVAKLAEACDAVGGVEKKGRNEFQRYAYVKAADVAKAIRHELFKRGVLVLINEISWEQERVIKTNSGGEVPLMRLKGEVSFRDEAETIGPFGAFATAFDSGDKAIYKAKTGLLKYALRGIGLIPDEKDDPEGDESVDEQTSERVAAGQNGSKKKSDVAAMNNFKVRAWASTCHENGKTVEQQAEFLKSRFGVGLITDLKQEQFEEALRWATASEPLTETIITSVAAAKTRKTKSPQPAVQLMDSQPDDIAGD